MFPIELPLHLYGAHQILPAMLGHIGRGSVAGGDRRFADLYGTTTPYVTEFAIA